MKGVSPEEIAVSTAVRNKLYNFDEFCVLVPDGQKADLIQGVIYVASPDNLDASRLFTWLITLMYSFVQPKRLGQVYGSRAAFRLGPHDSPEPDIAFVRLNRLHLRRRGYFAGRPDLALEIVSPDSVERDYRSKRLQYQEAGVLEYWIVDEIKKKVTLLRLDRHGVYREIRLRKGLLHSEVLTGFWLRPEWLWQDPLPIVTDVLAEING
jgi:Uma2 family endonuclease